jgi:uncharacterized repeat protein (TIGR03803 family)
MNNLFTRSKLFFFFAAFFISAISPLTNASAQNVFYGMTRDGGSNINGTIFSFDPSTNKDSVLWSFGNGNDGEGPQGDLVYDANNGLFYGMTFSGGTHFGTIFSFNPAINAENVVWNFGSDTDGLEPVADLVYNAGNGLFYGMTANGGTNGGGGSFGFGGTIFTFDPANNTENVVWNFGTGKDGNSPYGNLVYDASNSLYYGTTRSGGSVENKEGGFDGTIFSFNPSNNAENVVWNFGSGKDGQFPNGDLVYNPGNGLYYGTAYLGGDDSLGAIFSFNPIDDTEKTVWSFGSGTDGIYPLGSLVYHADNGLFYGTTGNGGMYGHGTFFTFDPASNAENVVWSFGATGDGIYPYSTPVYDADNGLFYETTVTGGANARGTIVSFNPANNDEKVLWSFGSGTDGIQPWGSLLIYPPVTGVKMLDNNAASVKISPDPNNGNFTVQLQNVKPNNQLEIFDVLGEKAFKAKLNSNTIQINLGEQAAGIYLYQVLNEQGELMTEGKFIVE